MAEKDKNQAVAVQRFWDAFKPYMERKQGTESNRFRVLVIPGEIDRLLSPLLQALKTEIRGLHYSIRTEKAYLKQCLPSPLVCHPFSPSCNPAVEHKLRGENTRSFSHRSSYY